MTADTTSPSTPTDRSGPSSSSGRLLVTARHLALEAQLRGAVVWWAFPAALLLGLVVVQPAWLADVRASLWQFVLWAAAVHSLVHAVIAVAVHLPVYVAGGIDRRTFVRAAWLSHLATLVVALVVGLGGMAVERAVLVPAGLEPGLSVGHLYGATDQYALVAAELVLTMTAAWSLGWLVALAYYRAGWLRGTLGALLALVPAVLVVGLLDARGAGTTSVLGLRVLGAFAAVVVAAVVADRLTATTELRGTSTWMRAG